MLTISRNNTQMIIVSRMVMKNGLLCLTVDSIQYSEWRNGYHV